MPYSYSTKGKKLRKVVNSKKTLDDDLTGPLFPVLSLENLIHRYKDSIILNINSFKVYPNETVVVFGPNGSGKSTLLRILNLLEKPSAGNLYFEGKKISELSDTLSLQRQMTMVFQEPLLFKNTVFENVAYGLRLRRYSKKKIKEKVETILERFGIIHLTNSFALNISAGESQKVALARGLVLQPKIFFLDEPLAALDIPTKEKMQEELKEIFKEIKTTAVYVTHDRTEALVVGDRLAVMNDGIILQADVPENIIERPLSLFVAKFMGAENIFSGEIVGLNDNFNLVKILDNRAVRVYGDGSVGDRVFICLRPEKIRIKNAISENKQNCIKTDFDDSAFSGTENEFYGKVEKIVLYGSFVKLYLDCGFSLIALASKQVADHLGLRKGVFVVAGFNSRDLWMVKS
jgi:ABC-type Fe3+/spermidine/putrescine transport system ATPase subunit